jgi:protein-S-isoprenylcysteine O-methyltransferase Ste14
MSVNVLRVLSLLAFAAPMLLATGREDPAVRTHPGRRPPARAPVAANFLAFGLFVAALIAFPGSPKTSMALPLALAGCLVALAGGAFLRRSRAELGPAWSLVPKADRSLVTTGPYRLVRHPVYLGLTWIATGAALAFASWPAFMVVLIGIVPTFVWRASAEEKLLSQTFGERYEAYQQGTWMIVPYLF